jgi:hypothetical protein
MHLGEIRRLLERLREAEALSEQLNDDRRRGRVSAYLSQAHSILGEPDEARVFGVRALEIAEHLGDVRLRILATTILEHAHYYLGEYERVVELATKNLAAAANRVPEGSTLPGIPTAIQDRYWLIPSLAQLGRFHEGSQCEADAIRLLAASTHREVTVGRAHLGWLERQS